MAVVDAIDLTASGVRCNAIRKDLISTCDGLVIDATRVPPELGPDPVCGHR
jgi:hypothetical protein